MGFGTCYKGGGNVDLSGTIYYFSGTGNSYRVAKTVSENINSKGVGLLNIADLRIIIMIMKK